MATLESLDKSRAVLSVGRPKARTAAERERLKRDFAKKIAARGLALADGGHWRT